MNRAVAVTMLAGLLGCDEVKLRDDAQTRVEDSAVDPSMAPSDGGFTDDDASLDAGEDDADAPPNGDDELQTPGASSPTPNDSGSASDASLPAATDAGRAITYADVQPIFWAKCTPCHLADAGGHAPFADTYDALRSASKLCPGQVVAACIPRAVEIEHEEGAGCRTFLQPFHREPWPCLTGDEGSAILGWQEPPVRGPAQN